MNTKKLLTNKSGFTLLEIIIVIIIIGVLASLALPKLFATVERSKAAEALANIGSIRSAFERCNLVKQGTYLGCDTAVPTAFAALDMADPTSQPGSHFGYALSGAGANGYTIVATRNGYDNPTSAACVITFVVDNTAANVITKTGTGTCTGI